MTAAPPFLLDELDDELDDDADTCELATGAAAATGALARTLVLALGASPETSESS
jgi:hypothetical protein